MVSFSQVFYRSNVAYPYIFIFLNIGFSLFKLRSIKTYVERAYLNISAWKEISWCSGGYCRGGVCCPGFTTVYVPSCSSFLSP